MFSSVKNLFKALDGAYSPNTLRNYQNDYARFERFCNAHNRTAIPADEGTVANYIKNLSSYYRLATIQRNLAAITFVHKYMGYQDPAKSVPCEIELKRAKRHLTKHQYQAFGITYDIRDKMIASCDNSLIGIRDAALIHFAYDSMCRASELICAEWNDINNHENGNHTLLIRKSKTDPEGFGRRVPLTQKCIDRLEEWKSVSNQCEGTILRNIDRHSNIGETLTTMSVNRIFKKRAKLIGINENDVRYISGHSTRVGSAQDLLGKGASLPQIMLAGGWKSTDMVMKYIEKADMSFINELRS